MNYRYNRHRLSRATGELVSWLEVQDPEWIVAQMAGWKETEWQDMRLAILMQGVGPYLHRTLPETAVYPCLPASLRGWLETQYELNRRRLQRMQAELAAILREARRAGIPVMPLKGSIIAWRYYAEPWQRPMADIDLLVRPEDQKGMAALLQQIGYIFDPMDSNQHAQHIVFANPDAAVVSLDGEHPDNPRPVEVHWRLRKGVWGRINECDFTEQVWAGATEEALCGEPAWLPQTEVLAAYLAFHATYHLLFQSGRLIQWVDLALLSPELPALWPDHADWTYPALRLAARAMPGRYRHDLAPWRAAVHPQMAAWAERVPLDGRCGLALGPPPYLVRRARLHWKRWWPTPWRLRLGYFDTPLPLAYGRHFINWGRRLWQKLRTAPGEINW